MNELRETAATIALLREARLPWPELVERIDELGSALTVLRGDGRDDKPEGTLFPAPRTPLADESTLGEIEAEVAAWQAEGMRVVSILDGDYPANLRTVHNRPPLLFVSGELMPDDERSVAVVGTRNPRVPANADPKVERRDALLGIAADVLAHLRLHRDKVAEPLLQLDGRVDPGQVGVAVPVAEPATHLHERVVGVRAPDVVADEQALQGQPARQPSPGHASLSRRAQADRLPRGSAGASPLEWQGEIGVTGDRAAAQP